MRTQAKDLATRWTHGVGFTVGLAVVVGALYVWRVPPGPTPPLGADVVFTVSPTGELAVAPVGRFLTASDLRPGGKAATGGLKIRNQTGTRLSVELRALANLDDLDHVLRVEIIGKQGVLFEGGLADLRSGTELLTLRRGRAQFLSFRAWIPPDAPRGYEGDVASVSIELVSYPEE
jgi:hypothetical protein